MHRTMVLAASLVLGCAKSPGPGETARDASQDARSAEPQGSTRADATGTPAATDAAPAAGAAQALDGSRTDGAGRPDGAAGDRGSRDGGLADLAPRDAGASAPRVFLISSALTTDPGHREFRSLSDFAARGPTCFAGGDEVRLAGGQRFVGTLRLRACVGAQGEVTVATSTGAPRATITVARTLAELGLSWEAVANPTFNDKAIDHLRGTPLFRARPIAQPVQQLYLGAARMTLARHPNPSTAGDPQYFRATAFYERAPAGCGAATCIRGDDAENATWALRTFGLGPGAFAVVRTSNWSLQRSEIVWHDPTKNSLAINDSLRTAVTGDEMPAAGFGFILFNTLPLLDQPGEWYYHPTEQALYFWPPNGRRPSAAETEVNLTAHGAAISGNFGNAPVDLRIMDLVIARPPAEGVALALARNLTVERVRVEQPEGNGISGWRLAGSSRVEDCTVTDAAGNGIVIGEVGGTTRVAHNRVLRPGQLHNQTRLGMEFNGIRVYRQRELAVVGNDVQQAGYAGVMLNPSTASLRVDDNAVTGFCTLLNDCAGIYFNGMDNTLTANQEMERNALVGGVGNTDGTPPHWPPLAMGIYLDHGASHVTLRDNRVERCRSDAGSIFLHGGNSNTISGNTVVATTGPALGLLKLAPRYATMAANVVELNTFTSSSPAHAVVRLIDPAAHDCAEMRPAIKSNNTLTHQTAADKLIECL